MAERQGLEVWGYRMSMKDRMRRFLVDVLDIHNKDVIEEVIGISSIRHCPKGRTLYLSLIQISEPTRLQSITKDDLC